MTKKIILGIAALIGFIIACAGVATMQMVMGSLIPDNKPDPDGKLEPDPQEKSKQEWEAKLKETGQTTSATKEEPVKQQEQQQEPSPTVVEQPAPPPQPVAPPPPPRIQSTGPGNFDAPPAYYPPPAPTGPGNM
jgi:hypothetical protein